MAPLSESARRCQQLPERERALLASEDLPGVDHPGDGHTAAIVPHRRTSGRRSHAGTEVGAVRPVRMTNDRKAVSPQAAGLRKQDAQRGLGGDCSVDGIAVGG